MTMPSRRNWTWLGRTLAVLFVVGLAILTWQLIDILFIAFGASLLAVLLCWLTGVLLRVAPLRRPVALAAVIVLLAAAFAAAVWLFGTTLTLQIGELARVLPESARSIYQELLRAAWGRVIITQLQQLNLGNINIVKSATGLLGSAFGLLADFVLIATAGIYLAAEPELYRYGILQLVPTNHVARAEQVLDAVGEAMRLWMVGQIFAMTVVGIMWGVSLWLLGVGSALALGVIAGLAEFIPVIGPILGAVPAVVIALAQSPILAFWAVIVYLIIQQIESSLLMPLIQARVVALPPAFTLFALVIGGWLFGIIGVLFAMPLAVVLMVLVRMLYIEDVLGKRTARPER